jgi:hypothetical protein
MEEGRGVYRVLVRRPEGKSPMERPRHRWECNIPVAGFYEHVNEPSVSIKKAGYCFIG